MWAGSAVDQRLTELIAADGQLAVTEPVAAEVAAGARTAAVALRTGAALLAQDADLARIAQVIPLRLDPATVRPSS